MLNLKRSSAIRNLHRERRDDLSLITGQLSGTGRLPNRINKRKRVRFEDDLKLRHQFLQARKQATAQENYNSSAGSSRDSFTTALTCNKTSKSSESFSSVQQNPDDEESSYFSENPSLKTSQYVSSGETTIRSVPALVKASDCKNAMLAKKALRGILKPSKSNCQPYPTESTRKTETEYWTSFIKRTDEIYKKPTKPKLQGLNMTKSLGTKGWSACSSFPITRELQPLIQQEIESLANYRVKGQRTPMQFLLNSIKPPTTPCPALIDPNNPLPQTTCRKDPSGVMVSEWMSRANLRSTPPITKNYSIAELMDIFCGFRNPSEADLTKQMFQPYYEPQQNGQQPGKSPELSYQEVTGDLTNQLFQPYFQPQQTGQPPGISAEFSNQEMTGDLTNQLFQPYYQPHQSGQQHGTAPDISNPAGDLTKQKFQPYYEPQQNNLLPGTSESNQAEDFTGQLFQSYLEPQQNGQILVTSPDFSNPAGVDFTVPIFRPFYDTQQNEQLPGSFLGLSTPQNQTLQINSQSNQRECSEFLNNSFLNLFSNESEYF